MNPAPPVTSTRRLRQKPHDTLLKYSRDEISRCQTTDMGTGAGGAGSCPAACPWVEETACSGSHSQRPVGCQADQIRFDHHPH